MNILIETAVQKRRSSAALQKLAPIAEAIRNPPGFGLRHYCAAFFLFLFALQTSRADSTVVFNEIMYHPAQTNEAQFEWVELYNQMAVDMDISGWYLTNAINYKFAEGTVVPGGGFLVIASSPADLRAATGATNVIGPFTGRLSNNGDKIELRNNNNRLMDSISYGVEGDWPVAPDGTGVSLTKRNPDLGSADPRSWTASARVGGTPGSENFPVPHIVTTTKPLVPIEQVWRYDQSGTDFSTNATSFDWAQPAFNDSAWPSGPGLLALEGCGCLPEPIRTTLTLGRTTYYFRTSFNLTNDPASVTLSLKHVIDDGMILYLNGKEVWRVGMAAGPASYATFANRGVGDGVYEGPFTIPSTDLLLGTNVLAAEVHQGSAGSSDITFGLSLDQLITTTVGQSQSGGLASIAFNELTSSTNSAFEIELHNYGATNVSLGGLVLARLGGANREYVFPSLTLPPGAYMELSKTDLGFGADSGDKLVLYSADRGTVLDAVVAKRAPRGRHPDGTGEWLLTDLPTFGAANSFGLHNEIVINEIMYDHRPIPATPAQFATNLLVSITNTWRYNQQGSQPALNWQDPSYNDAAWSSGRALFYNTASALPAAKNTQISLTNSSGGRLVTWYFRNQFVFNGSFSGLQLALRPIIDDGAVFYLNGVEIYRLNMADGPVGYTNLAALSVATAAYTGPFAVPTNRLVLGTNVLAVEVHQFTTNALGADVVFGTEFYATAQTSPPLPFRDSPETWVELYNRSGNAVDLTGWELDGGISYSFPSNKVIPAGGYILVAKDVAYMQGLYPSLEFLGPFGGNLSHQDDEIILKDPRGNPANRVHYYSGGRWPGMAHAGGSSLELRDPRSDNSKAEAWQASDEAGKTQWATYSYRATASTEPAASPTSWRDFDFGLLTEGEVLLDDFSVIDLSNSTQLLQNGSFENGATTWRILGNHKGRVEVDPVNPNNHVLHLIASGPTEHMHNHVETTLTNNLSVVNGRDYQISFRAKWLTGSRDLHTRLYFNRAPAVTALAVPALTGTPGARNSRYAANVGPTYEGFRHLPVVPNASQSVNVSVSAQDPDGVASMILWWSANGGAWNQAPMTLSNGLFAANVPGNAASTLVQFYVEGVDTLGAHSTYPRDGTNARALFRVNDSQAIFDRLHNIRILTTSADADFMHAATNVQSNDILGCTVIYDERQVFYNVGVHLQGSERGRNDSSRVGFTMQFDPDNLFRGVHDAITLDKSGGYAGRGGKHDEILLKHMINHAGGMPGMYDDIAHTIAPRSSENGTGLLIMAKYGDVYLDSQYKNGGDGNLFKLELIYFPTTTLDGTPQGLKLPQPDDVLGTEIQDLGNNKEAYRWTFLNENNHLRDDYSGIMNVAKTFSFSGAALDDASKQTLDVDEWMRVFAFQQIGGVADTYGVSLPHNFMIYIRPEDQKALALSWDMDFAYYNATSASIYPGANVAKLLTIPANQRIYLGHLLDLITTTCNTTYVSQWANRYGSVVGQNWSGITTYIGDRASFILSQLPMQIPFSITSNSGNDFSTNNNLVVLSGVAPIQVKTIEINGISYPITWTTVSNWTVRIPIGTGANLLTARGINNYGNPVSGAVDTITVTDTTPVPAPNGFVVINEIMYHSAVEGAGFVEIHNIHPTVTFDLSNWRLDGADFTFPEGSIILPGGFLVAASDVNIFASTYGSAIPVAGQYLGNLQNSGETLKLVRPVSTNVEEVIDIVRYDDQAPWPTDADGLGPSLQLIDPTQSNYSPANWAAVGYTPGRTNSVRATLPAFPSVAINELLSVNTNGISDNFGQQEPWIELFNSGSSAISLEGLYLTDNFSNVTQWAFPAGSSIGPKQFAVIWADGEPEQSTPSAWHTSFRLSGSGGSIALARNISGTPEVLDYINYGALSVNHSFGSWPDGDPAERQLFFYVTPGASNNPAAPPLPVVINEWMADNAAPGGFPQYTGLYRDWFELFNPNTNAVDLSGYFLSDTLTQPDKWRIPNNTFISGRSFLLVWADNDTSLNASDTNGDLHANFQLSAGGEAIGLFAPDGTQQAAVTFGQQIQNVSQGLFPDGNTNGIYLMTNFTPRAANTLAAPAPPHIEQISVNSGGVVEFTFSVSPGARYQIEFRNDLGSGNWLPVGTPQTAASAQVTYSENMGANGQRFYRVIPAN